MAVEEPYTLQVTQALVVLVKHPLPSAAFDRILYFHAARADRLLHDVVTEQLLPLQAHGITDIYVGEVETALARWVHAGKMTSPWGDHTIRRVTRGLLSTLRDFGVLTGVVNKRISSLSDRDWRPLADLLAERLAHYDPARDIAFLTRVAAMSPGVYHMSKRLLLDSQTFL